jgi:hypoxanthine phosphoribosyltransferase
MVDEARKMIHDFYPLVGCAIGLLFAYLYYARKVKQHGSAKKSNIKKRFISPDELRLKSFQLGKQISDKLQNSNETKEKVYVVGLWRGGSFIACCVDEFLQRKGFKTDCVAVRTSRYCGIGQEKSDIQVHSLGYLRHNVKENDRVILVDDVWDSGTSIQEVKKTLADLKANVQIAVVFFKPMKNKFPNDSPMFFVEESDEWLCFPHELEGLDDDEIVDYFGASVLELLELEQNESE